MCVLNEEKPCNECGQCDICDLDANKICDNCCHCIDTADYLAIEITDMPETSDAMQANLKATLELLDEEAE